MPHGAPPPSGPGAPAALDARLLGTWSDEPGGAMEASTVFFAPDGTGSSTLLNAAGADDTTRFRWSCPGPGRLLLEEESFSECGGPPVPATGTLLTGYRIFEADGTDGAGGAAVVLEFAEPVEFAFRYRRVPGACPGPGSAAGASR
ncbi:hypothetical protein ACF06W_26085 [Streptomyces albus]|uniref:hypothetical protein n=1 Tax=Streptomyces albus TaxID=1888 RepID=UPI0036F8B7AC